MGKAQSGVTFFLERSAGQEVIASKLRSMGYSVVLHEDVCADNAQDEKWLRLCGENRWIAITRDQNVYKNPLELTAIRDERASVFIITSGQVTNEQIAEILERNVEAMLKFAREHPPPMAAAVTAGGIQLRYDVSKNKEDVFRLRFSRARKMKRKRN
jgi:predicted nuclease of predicted toxin-antitoxin system